MLLPPTMISARRAWFLTGLWALLIFGLSSIPGRALPEVALFAGTDKVAHLGIYAVLGALAFVAARATWTTAPGAANVAVATALAICFGITDELHQLFVPARSADVVDVAADGLGALAGAIAAARCSVRRAT
jgi:VanZ family protein